MLRTLLISSALASLLVPSVLAQDVIPVPVAPTELEQVGLTPPTVLSEGYASQGQDVLVTRLLGEKIYASIADDAEDIGTINDMVVTSGQGISAVIVGVGGFLGVGEKDVAVAFADLDWAERADGSRRWVLGTTRDALNAAPAFIWTQSEAATGPAMTPAQEQEQLVEGDPNATPIDPTLTTDQPDAQPTTEQVDRTALDDFDESTLGADDLRGTGVYGIDDQQIGSIGDVLPAAGGGIDAVIVDVGGFLGLGAKPVAVGFENLTFSSDTFGNRYLFLNTTREQLEAQPTYNPETYATDRASQRMVIAP
ncbi:PRC-barrel domain-containing protein [Devosia limi]|uniref:PRC-barrel domain-containing protein n=1 Tax=Devosia limi DSM 17137 TaxID=1121477 RepID=A0A1M4X7G2_9HYPH|nr:PRC-barrel domain-containing protein [Devosia limi]SHE89397.1 PRC-barrel domain-containing protein [Devosia limi DSM 17137]